MKLKCLDLNGLNRLVNNLKIASVPKEYAYHLTLTANQSYSFTIPNYSSQYSLIEVYLNGMRLIEDVHYTLSTNGVVDLKFNVHTEGNNISFIHRKW